MQIFGKELYVVLLADGRDFIYLVLMFVPLFLDRVALMNNIYLSEFALDLSCLFIMRDGQSC